jgi:hypothetical protein
MEHIEPLYRAQAVEDGGTRRIIQFESINESGYSVPKRHADVPR